MKNWRQSVYNVVETNGSSIASHIYDTLMLCFILMSIIPLMFRETSAFHIWCDYISVSVFILDYILRWMTADLRMPKYRKWVAFLLYPITPLAIIDILSILPSIALLDRAFKLFRMTRLFKILRVMKFLRYSKNLQILTTVLIKERNILFTVFLIAVGYIIVTALIMFNVEESEMFETYFDALYWATTTLTTVGYGDIYPATSLGRIISMFSAIFGVAVIALPSGVITASYLEELRERRKEEQEKKNQHAE